MNLSDISCIRPERIQYYWPLVSDWLASSTNKCGDWTITALLDSLVRGESLLWVQCLNDVPTAACVTQVVQTRKGKILTINALGGTRADAWPQAFAPIEAYARDLGCRAIRFEGRRGWQRVFPDYDLKWICLEKELV